MEKRQVLILIAKYVDDKIIVDNSEKWKLECYM